MTRSDRLLGSSWRRFAAGRSRAVIAEARHISVPAGCCQFQVSASTPLYHLTRIHPATISTYHTRRYSAAASHRLPRHASASPSALPPQASHLLVNCAQSLQSIHHLTKVQSLDLPVLPAWPQLPKHQSSRPLQGKGKLCERLNCYFCCCIVCTNVTMM